MTTLTKEGDGIIGKRIVYVARKVSGPRLIMKSGRHRRNGRNPLRCGSIRGHSS